MKFNELITEERVQLNELTMKQAFKTLKLGAISGTVVGAIGGGALTGPFGIIAGAVTGLTFGLTFTAIGTVVKAFIDAKDNHDVNLAIKELKKSMAATKKEKDENKKKFVREINNESDSSKKSTLTKKLASLNKGYDEFMAETQAMISELKAG